MDAVRLANDNQKAPGAAVPTVEIRNLSLAYNGVAALRDIDLDVRQGEFLALLGPSGCGKTSLLRSIAGYVHPQQGTMRIGGRDVLNVPPRRRNIGMVFQNYALFPHMTAAENIAFGLSCRGIPARDTKAAVDRMLDLVGLVGFGDRKPRGLSGGQQQRVALARALVIQPDVLLLDEALSALDKSLRVQMQSELKDIQRRIGLAAVFVTHDQEEAMAIADRIAVMRDGCIEQLDEPQHLFQYPAKTWVAEFIGAGNLLKGNARIVDAETMQLEGIGGLDCCFPHQTGVSAGDAVTAFARADHVALEIADAAAPALMITGRRFLGSRVEIQLQVQEGQAPLKALVPMEQADPLAVGRRVHARIAARDCRIIVDRDAKQ
jgi:ABC-type Fe3+/spermidine/putrescine transport system ATPase subunit